MPNTAESQSRSWLEELLRGDVTLAAFQRSFASVAWNLGSHAAVEESLARTIELRLAEYTSGHLTEDELMSALDRLAARPLQSASAWIKIKKRRGAAVHSLTGAHEFNRITLGVPVSFGKIGSYIPQDELERAS